MTESVAVPFCHAHSSVEAPLGCDHCSRPTCQTCVFLTEKGRFCPDCMSVGPAAGPKRSSLALALGSMAAAGAAVLALIGLLLLSGKGRSDQGTVTLLETATSAFSLTGLTLGLMGRDAARRTGSPLPLMGIIGNGLTFALYLTLSFIALATYKFR
jgi:hypothetical protein